ncbi:MAG TPA: DUF4349 domain-containing protein, partial [Terriglobales bacterium]|nr:DUF4349 domain-containing protein [Terriglobales bacterium]
RQHAFMQNKTATSVDTNVTRSLEAPSTPGTVEAATTDRRTIRKSALDLIVGSPSGTIGQITSIARQNGGYVVSSDLTGRQENERGVITIRVPAAQFDLACNQLRKLASRVESEQTSADDVTMQFVENEATLRNFRAEEASYLEIMKQSRRIKDTLEVAQQLSDVRGRIERLQAQIRTMSLETEMAAIQVTVSAEPIAVAGQHWRPLYELRAAWNDGTDAMTTYATAMIAIIMYLPATLLWLATIVAAAKLGWILLRLAIRFFRAEKPEPAAS